MEYKSLFEQVMSRKTVVFRAQDYPDNIVMPLSGYAVYDDHDECSSVWLDESTKVMERMWQNAVERAVDDARVFNVEYVMVTTILDFGVHRLVIGPAHVFSKKEYAMGYAHGGRIEEIYDIAMNIEVKRKNK